MLLDAHAQAGVVGASSRDLFADAALKLSVPVEGLRVGPGLWAAAQPDLARLDAGPQVSMRLPVTGNVRLSADWRFWIAGDAAPALGPSITLATDF